MKIETRLEKLERTMSSTPCVDEQSFERLFEWMSDMGWGVDKNEFFAGCNERDLHTGHDYINWVLNEIDGKFLDLPSSVTYAIKDLMRVWKSSDLDKTRTKLERLVNGINPNIHDRQIFGSTTGAKILFEMFEKTGLKNSNHNTPAGRSYSRLVDHLARQKKKEQLPRYGANDNL